MYLKDLENQEVKPKIIKRKEKDESRNKHQE
jgi:hypothetical protein